MCLATAVDVGLVVLWAGGWLCLAGFLSLLVKFVGFSCGFRFCVGLV